MGISVFSSGLLLKYSRNAESQADLGGVQAVNASNIDTNGMMTFFQKLEGLRKSEPGKLENFFSSHPPPADRVKAVGEEIVKLPLQKNPAKDSDLFQKLKIKFKAMPPPAGKTSGPSSPKDSTAPGKIPEPSSRVTTYQQQNRLYQFEFPDNWQVMGQGGAGVTIAPPGGAGAQNQITHGMMANVFEEDQNHNQSLEKATEEFVEHLQHGNPHLKEVSGSQSRFKLGGARALSTVLGGTPPRSSQPENVWVITRSHPDGLFYFVFVVPENEFRNYKPVFERIMKSASFPRQR